MYFKPKLSKEDQEILAKYHKESVNVISVSTQPNRKKEEVNLTDYLNSFILNEEIQKINANFGETRNLNTIKALNKKIVETININNMTQDKLNQDAEQEKLNKLKALYSQLVNEKKGE